MRVNQGDVVVAADVSLDVEENVAVAVELHMMKMGKILRMFRALRFLRELRVMLQTILGSAVSLFWSVVTLLLILYVFALLFIQEFARHVADNELPDEEIAEIDLFFGSVSASMLSLYMCTNGGFAWINIYTLAANAGVLSQCAFIFFVAFFNFAVLNILSGIFLEKALNNGQPDRDQQALEKRRSDLADAAALSELFKKMDVSGDGYLSAEEFEVQIRDGKVRGYLESMDIDVKDASVFYNCLLEICGQNELAIDDFVEHCTRMKGNATATDVAQLSMELKMLRREVREISPSQQNRKPITDADRLV
jgi:hypothetical protein